MKTRETKKSEMEGGNMHILGSMTGGILALEGDVIIPGGHTVMTFNRSSFDPADVWTMLENPHEKAHAVVVPKGKYDEASKRFSSFSCFVEVSHIDVRGSVVQLAVGGIERVNIAQVIKDSNGRYYVTDMEKVKPHESQPEKIHMMASDIMEALKKLEDSQEHIQDLKQIGSNMDYFADYVLYGLGGNEKEMLEYLNTRSVMRRMEYAHRILCPEQYKTEDKGMDNTEKIKSKDKDVQAIIDSYYELREHMNEKADKEIYNALKSLSKQSPNSSDYTKLTDFCTLSIELPWVTMTEDNDISYIEKKVNSSHYGMEKPKERIMEYMAIQALNPDAKGTVLLLNGPPGTGKTTLAQSVADAMGRKHERISLGGCNDTSFMKGHSRTYVGAKEGRLITAMRNLGVKNPVIILDEVEKVSRGTSGDPEAALLELLDPNQNDTFTDTYLGYGFDMSEVLFICTSNNAEEIFPALRDRMEVIEIRGYSMDEKIKIAADYVVPKKSKELGVPDTKISKKALTEIITGYTREPGIRGLEKNIDNVLRKVALDRTKGKTTKVTKSLIHKRLGLPYEEDRPDDHRIPGLVAGLYYSHDGGGCLTLEGVIRDKAGKGKISMTGKLGEVMKESLELVHSHMIAKQEEYGLDAYNIKEVDIHVHVPAGSVPKDGPSAGAAFSLLLASLAANKPVRPRLAMTGECTLTGRITAIGGVDQKCAGAIRMGMEHIILPKTNKRDYEKLPNHVKKAATYHFVQDVAEVLEIGLNY